MTTILTLPVEPEAVSNLVVTETLAGTGLLLTFSTETDPNHWATEIWASVVNDRASAVLIDTVVTDTYLYVADAGISRYFWIRSVNVYGRPASTWYPLSELAGVSGTVVGVASKDLQPNAVSLSSFGVSVTPVVGAGGVNYTSVVTFTVTNDTDVVLPFSFQLFAHQKYTAGAVDTKWIIRDATLDLTIYDWGTITSLQELPSLATVYAIPANTTRTIILYWWGADATVSLVKRSFNFLALKELG